MSAVVPSGTVAMTSSVWGEITSMSSVPVEATHSPPMYRVSFSIMDRPFGVGESRIIEVLTIHQIMHQIWWS